MPNPWDIGSAVFLERLGFKALATTSAGFAFTRGRPDAAEAITCDMMLGHIREIVRATSLPVNADFQSGFARLPEDVAANVTRCVRTGASGLSIEDSSGDLSTPLFARELAVERIRASREAIDATGIPVVLTARCESWLVGDRDPAGTALDRLVAYAEAGADCLYAPGVREEKTIETIVRAVAPRPVNVLAFPGISVRRLAELGVRRISVGGALARVGWAAFMAAAKNIAETGAFDALGGGVPSADLNRLFGG